jgi:AcrR family transcriptional regulator
VPSGRPTAAPADPVPVDPAPPDPAPPDPPPVDGRTARAERTRTAIVDALLGLLEEGDLQPPASRIAERAGISLRLIYHHFGDLESLFRAASAREAERLSVFVAPIDATLPVEERIDLLVAQRATLLERLTPVRRAALLQEPFSEELRAARDAFQEIGCDQVRTLFAPELEALPEARRAAAATAAATALLWGFWNDLRTTGGSPAESAAALRELLRALLRP